MNYNIVKSNNADSRTATSNRKEDLKIDTLQHMKDVQSVMNLLAVMLIENSINHDFTKLSKFDEFYKDWSSDSGNFTDKDWYKYHISNERHHSKAYEQEDYNLLDLIEELADKVCAGKSRSGTVEMKYFEYDNELIQKALMNTIKLVDKMTM